MATNDILLTGGTDIVVAHTTYVPTGGNSLGTRTDQINLTSLGAGAARESDKIDFGATFARQFALSAAIEFATAPVAGEAVRFYMGFSNNATAGTANPGGLSGADAAYAGYSSNLDESKKQLFFIGSMILTVQATAVVQIDMLIGNFRPSARWGILVVENGSVSDVFHSDAVEMAVLIHPLKDQIQAAV